MASLRQELRDLVIKNTTGTRSIGQDDVACAVQAILDKHPDKFEDYLVAELAAITAAVAAEKEVDYFDAEYYDTKRRFLETTLAKYKELG